SQTAVAFGISGEFVTASSPLCFVRPQRAKPDTIRDDGGTGVNIGAGSGFVQWQGGGADRRGEGARGPPGSGRSRASRPVCLLDARPVAIGSAWDIAALDRS